MRNGINDSDKVPTQYLTCAFCKLVSNTVIAFDTRKVNYAFT